MTDPIYAYFAQYPYFDFKPSHSDWRQIDCFNALAQFEDWSQSHRSAEFSKLQDTWPTFVEAEFYGDTLPYYQKLCNELRIHPVPDTIPECKEKLSTVHVNIIDLVTFRVETRYGLEATPPKLFGSVQELKEYTKKEKKWYPTRNAKAEILKVLLRVIY
jgi:hypothetical protein